MHQGVRRDGSYLYPAFPYTHFTKVTDDDIAALYAFLMTRPPVENTVLPPELPFPLNIRLGLAGWNLLFFTEGRFTPDQTRDEVWNRGAYIAEGLGHCSSCHTPLNFLGAERTSEVYAGGVAEGWVAPALSGKTASPIGWNRDELVAYLRGDFSKTHGIAAGPMRSVSSAIRKLPRSDIEALATYVASLGHGPSATERAEILARAERASLNSQGSADLGETIFVGACASCHVSGLQQPFHKPASLALSSAVNADDPRNFLLVIMRGVERGTGYLAPSMPAFDAVLDDGNLEKLANYVRERFAPAQPRWENVAGAARALREEEMHAEAHD
jgi:nicotinate dehydrogenase subunit B